MPLIQADIAIKKLMNWISVEDSENGMIGGYIKICIQIIWEKQL
jgi:hypothetical protein